MQIASTVLLLLTAPLSSLFAFQTETENIASSKYFDTTLTEINNAKSSIDIYMYLISVIPDQPDTQANQLVNALIKAKGRGVVVKVVLDQNIDFTDAGRDDEAYHQKNQEAYELLKRNNIPVFFDEADTYTHAKAIIIDKETVILGSTNWSKAALTRNNEASALIRSKEFATNLLNDLSRVKLQEGPLISRESIVMERGFLADPKLFGEMVTQNDERAFDIYLYSLKEYNGNKDSNAILDLDKLAESLGIADMGNEAYRRQIIKVLEKLRDKYKLVDFADLGRNKDAEVILMDIKDGRKRYALPETDFFLIPTNYFKYVWNKKLSLRAKAFYLINLSKSKKSNPSWFMSRETISKQFNISETFITDGIRELRQQNLLDVQYDSIEASNYDERLANVYTPLELYDPQELDKKLKNLESKHGKEKLERAKANAGLVFEDKNLKTIIAMVELEDQFGQNIVQEAAKKIAEKNTDNPKRSAGYFINTVKSMGEGK